MSLLLLGTSACHLCDQAQTILAQASAARPLRWQLQDIALDDGLVTRYGERIPVLLRDDGAELNWPFSLLDVLRFAQK